MNRTENVENRKKILVVDDERLMREIIRGLLELTGLYFVQIAQDGETAINLLRQQAFDLLITDYEMPRMNGYELFKICKDLRPELPVMFTTGSESNEEIIEKAKSEGAIGCIYKPFSLDEMLTMVAQIHRKKEEGGIQQG